MQSVKAENVNVSEDLLACRVCLATGVKLFNIYRNGLEKAFLELLGTTVSASDGFPQHVCAFCLQLLGRFREFYNRSRRAQQLLEDLQKHHSITTSSISNIDRLHHNLMLDLTFHTFTTLIECEHQDLVIKYEVEIESKNEPVVKYEDGDVDELDDIINAEEISYKEIETKKIRSKRKTKVEKGKIEKEKFEAGKVGMREVGSREVGSREVGSRKVGSRKVGSRKVGSREKKKLPKEKKIKKMFDCEADFPAFESKYNMEIVVLTMEQQLENMASRKNSSNYINSPFKCEMCFKGFSSEATIKNHNLKHHDPSVGAQQCPLCHSRFRIPAFLRTHAETHRLKFVCRDCRFVASNRYHAITHFREHSGFKYVCKYCGASFKKPSTHGTHVRIQHPTENTSCDICGETFQGESGLRMHKTRAHKQSSENETDSLNCSTCGVQFASSYAMSRHTFTAPDNVCNPSMRACTQCGENLATEELLKSHVEERHSKPETKCDECNKTFLTEASLSVHYERVHLQVKSVRRKAAHLARKQYGGVVMCELCGKRCKNSTILKYHQRTHTGEKPHSCPRCPKRFVSPMLLHCHLRSHTGERPYKCTQCHKSFTQKSALTVHKTVHSGEKPFTCAICGKSFTQAASVHTHVKYVHMKMPAPPRRRILKQQ